LSESSQYREELLGLIHDLNNHLVVLVGLLDIISAPCEEHTDVLLATRRMVMRIRETEGRLCHGPGVEEEVITVDDLVEKVREVAEALPFPATLHLRLTDADRKRQVAYSDYGRDVIGDNLESNWRAAGVTELHGVVRLDQIHESVAVEIIDNGCGMSPATLAKIRTGPMLGEGDKGKGCQLVRRACAASGRTVSWDSIQYAGTKVTIRYRLVNGVPDSVRPPPVVP